MDRRREHRFHQRMACQLELHGRRCHGVVLNVSPRGLFVQTRAKTSARADVAAAVEMVLAKTNELLKLQAVVVRQFWVPDPLLAPAHGGIGLAIPHASSAWSGLLDELEAKRPVPLRPLRPLRRTHCQRCRREVPTSSGVCSWCCGEP